MCTVAFVPLDDGGYVLGHNRDESRARSRGRPPGAHRWNGRTILAPTDPDADGTWIGVHGRGVAQCVLNATEPDPERLSARPRSRGLVLRDVLHLDDADAVFGHLEDDIDSLRDVRSFHLVVASPGDRVRPARSHRIRWDGCRLVRDQHDGPWLYVSSSLDLTGAERERGRSWLRLLESKPLPDGDVLRRWLASHEPERGPLSVCMHRPEAKTVSRTMVTVDDDGIEMAYVDGSPCAPLSDERLLRI